MEKLEKKKKKMNKKDWMRIGALALALVTVVGIVAGCFYIPHNDDDHDHDHDHADETILTPSENGTLYALVLEDYLLAFAKLEKEPAVGMTYSNEEFGKKNITAIYANFENSVFESESDVIWGTYKESIYQISVDSTFAPVSTAYWFSGFNKCFSMNLKKLDTSNVTTMNSMFAFCNELFDVDLSSWNTSNVTDMSHLLQSCHELSHLNISEWDTSKVTDMTEMFEGCESLSFDPSSWNLFSILSFENFNENAPEVVNPFVKEGEGEIENEKENVKNEENMGNEEEIMPIETEEVEEN